MKAHEIFVGQVYLAKVSGIVQEVKVERETEMRDGRLHWICVNLATGRKVRVRGPARFRSRIQRDIREVAAQEPAAFRLENNDIQEKVDRLFRKYGGDVLMANPDYDTILAAEGLKLEDITLEVRKRAERHCRDWLLEQFRNHNSNSGRAFNVVVDGEPEFQNQALHRPCSDNRIGDGIETKQATRSKIMQVNEADARQLLRAMGQNKAADKASKSGLEKRLNDGKYLAKFAEKCPEGESLSLLKSIGDAISEGEQIKVVMETSEVLEEMAQDAAPVESQEEQDQKSPKGLKIDTRSLPKKKNKKFAAKAGKAERKKTSPEHRGEKIGIDKFGSRLGSNNAQFNTTLSHKPKKMAELVQEAGLKGTYYDHVGKLVEAGFVAKTDEGYKLLQK